MRKNGDFGTIFYFIIEYRLKREVMREHRRLGSNPAISKEKEKTEHESHKKIFERYGNRSGKG